MCYDLILTGQVNERQIFMNSKFFDLKKEKQDRMINAALKIFALHGYRRASTDDIVREAAISKGLLFHYFENKIGIYHFVYDYSVRYMALELKSAVNAKETNLFELLRQMEFGRMTAMRSYPYMQQFLNTAMHEDVSEALLSIEEKRSEFVELNDRLLSQADFSMLPTGLDGDKLVQMLDFTVKGLMTSRFQDSSFQPEMLYEEIRDYINLVEKMTQNYQEA